MVIPPSRVSRLAAILGVLDWFRSVASSDTLDVGDPVRINMESGAQQAAQYDGRDGHIEEIISNPDGQDGRLYAIELLDSEDKVYLNRDQFDRLD